MTGSFSCMMLSAMLIFDNLDEDKEKSYIDAITAMGNNIISREEIRNLIDKEFDRVVYLGSGCLCS